MTDDEYKAFVKLTGTTLTKEELQKMEESITDEEIEDVIGVGRDINKVLQGNAPIEFNPILLELMNTLKISERSLCKVLGISRKQLYRYISGSHNASEELVTRLRSYMTSKIDKENKNYDKQREVDAEASKESPVDVPVEFLQKAMLNLSIQPKSFNRSYALCELIEDLRNTPKD